MPQVRLLEDAGNLQGKALRAASVSDARGNGRLNTSKSEIQKRRLSAEHTDADGLLTGPRFVHLG